MAVGLPVGRSIYDPPMPDVRVVDNQERRQYELWVGDQQAGYISYGVKPGAVVLIHTEVDPKYEGQGLGSQLVRGALDDIRSRGMRLIPLCPFVRAYLERHPEQRDLVGDGRNAEGGSSSAPQ
jgi:predicted GNAT family acetyltransferase